jgi:hypothetical protein
MPWVLQSCCCSITLFKTMVPPCSRSNIGHSHALLAVLLLLLLLLLSSFFSSPPSFSSSHLLRAPPCPGLQPLYFLTPISFLSISLLPISSISPHSALFRLSAHSSFMLFCACLFFLPPLGPAPPPARHHHQGPLFATMTLLKGGSVDVRGCGSRPLVLFEDGGVAAPWVGVRGQVESRSGSGQVRSNSKRYNAFSIK